jgi:hypothetical protein
MSYKDTLSNNIIYNYLITMIYGIEYYFYYLNKRNIYFYYFRLMSRFLGHITRL